MIQCAADYCLIESESRPSRVATVRRRSFHSYCLCRVALASARWSSERTVRVGKDPHLTRRPTSRRRRLSTPTGRSWTKRDDVRPTVLGPRLRDEPQPFVEVQFPPMSSGQSRARRAGRSGVAGEGHQLARPGGASSPAQSALSLAVGEHPIAGHFIEPFDHAGRRVGVNQATVERHREDPRDQRLDTVHPESSSPFSASLLEELVYVGPRDRSCMV